MVLLSQNFRSPKLTRINQDFNQFWPCASLPLPAILTLSRIYLFHSSNTSLADLCLFLSSASVIHAVPLLSLRGQPSLLLSPSATHPSLYYILAAVVKKVRSKERHHIIDQSISKEKD